MTDHALPSGRRHVRRGAVRRMLVPLSMVLLTALAGAPAAYMLWPQSRPAAPDAPSLPITVGTVTFNAPPAAIRFKMQRRAGPQPRIDLVFMWPSLDPPEPASALTLADAPKVTERIFLTIAGSGNTLPPAERLKAIYPRYLAPDPVVSIGGLHVRPFRAGTPYQGEDLVLDPAAPERLLMRCTQSQPRMPGTCLHEKRIGDADIVVRFPRDWLVDWQAVAGGIDRLIRRLTPAASPH